MKVLKFWEVLPLLLSSHTSSSLALVAQFSTNFSRFSSLIYAIVGICWLLLFCFCLSLSRVLMLLLLLLLHKLCRIHEFAPCILLSHTLIHIQMYLSSTKYLWSLMRVLRCANHLCLLPLPFGPQNQTSFACCYIGARTTILWHQVYTIARWWCWWLYFAFR